MNCYYTGQYRRRPVAAQSTFMRTEEIQREREMSGWNPYEGEEEQDWMERPYTEMPEQRSGQIQMPGQNRMPGQMQMPGQNRMSEGMSEQRSGQNWMPGQMQMPDQDQMPEQIQIPNQMPGQEQMMARPYFLRPDYEDVLEDAKQEERDFRALQAMYPEAAKLLLPYIEDECDQMEYEGSMMFDEYPDQVSVRRIGQRIEQQTQGLFPEGSTKVQEQMPEELFSMQHSGPGRNRPGQNWLGDLIHVMLLQEMHHRRCRHRRCRNHL